MLCFKGVLCVTIWTCQKMADEMRHHRVAWTARERFLQQFRINVLSPASNTASTILESDHRLGELVKELPHQQNE
jgi:hypothetical protein